MPPTQLDLDGDGFTPCDGDCDDKDAAVFPYAAEVCDGLDNDCDPSTSETSDQDGDGYSPCTGDCDDSDSTRSPGASDQCNGVDDDCDGVLESGDVDADADGYAFCPQNGWGDCDDSNPLIHPDAVEICDGEDNDCLPDTEEEDDADGDGYTICDGDCAEGDASSNPGASEICDQVDNDCDGFLPADEIDGDGDSFVDCTPSGSTPFGYGDCDDTNAVVYPQNSSPLCPAIETCDGVDSDCSGSIGQDEVDDDADNYVECEGWQGSLPYIYGGDDCDDRNAAINPGATEVCDQLDNDCNGAADAGAQPKNILVGQGPGTAALLDNFAGNVVVPQRDLWVLEFRQLIDIQPGDQVTAYILGEDTGGDWSVELFSSTYQATSVDILAASGAVEIELELGETYTLGFHVDRQTNTYLDTDDKLRETFTTDWSWEGRFGASTPDSNGASLAATDRYVQEIEIIPDTESDVDGDGFAFCSGDCVEVPSPPANNAYPGNTSPEVCDGVDNDCDASWLDGEDTDADGDGVFGCLDCDDTDPAVGAGPDADGDGFAYCATPTPFSDCDDAAAAVYPGAPELCDGLDNDCDGQVPGDETDADQDGQLVCDGDCNDALASVGAGFTELCDGLDNDCDGHVPSPSEDDLDGDGARPCSGDCNDGDASVATGFPELCDGVDNDCDGQVPSPLEDDQDGDGWLVCQNDCLDSGPLAHQVHPGASEACDGLDSDCDGSIPSPSEDDVDTDGFMVCEGDCNDAESSVNPGASEICDELDNDCDGSVPADETTDADADGVIECLDCDDADANNYPGNSEVCDGLDNDCSGAPDADPAGEVDADGDLSLSCDDCDDADAANTPGGTEICDGQDNDCSGAADPGEVDADGDGVLVCAGDCDDGDLNTYPGAPELCDGLDNDCSGGVPSNEADGDGDGVLVCAGDCDDTDATVAPGSPELCDGLDNDCDGQVPADEQDVDGDLTATCAGDCDDGDPLTYPGAIELCDGVDNDCDAQVPANEADGDADGVRICGGDCDDGDAANYPGNTEVCDGQDNDCANGADADPAGEVDADADGSLSCLDCDDADPANTPGGVEVCDGQDNDCSNGPDFDAAGEVDADSDGSISCVDCDDGDPANAPGGTEVCDGQDNDCDGSTPADEADGDADGFAPCAGDCEDTDPAAYPGAPENCEFIDLNCNGQFDCSPSVTHLSHPRPFLPYEPSVSADPLGILHFAWRGYGDELEYLTSASGGLIGASRVQDLTDCFSPLNSVYNPAWYCSNMPISGDPVFPHVVGDRRGEYHLWFRKGTSYTGGCSSNPTSFILPGASCTSQHRWKQAATVYDGDDSAVAFYGGNATGATQPYWDTALGVDTLSPGTQEEILGAGFQGSCLNGGNSAQIGMSRDLTTGLDYLVTAYTNQADGDGLQKLWLSVRDPVLGWLPATKVADMAGNDQDVQYPDIAVDPATGERHVVFVATENGYAGSVSADGCAVCPTPAQSSLCTATPTNLLDGVYYTSQLPGGTWSTPLRLSSSASPGATEPGIALDSLGQPHVVWNWQNGSTFDLEYLARITGSWTVPTFIASIDHLGQTETKGKIAVDGCGLVAIPYKDGASSAVGIAVIDNLPTVSSPSIGSLSQSPSQSSAGVVALDNQSDTAAPGSIALRFDLEDILDGQPLDADSIYVRLADSSDASLDLDDALGGAELDIGGATHVGVVTPQSIWFESTTGFPQISDGQSLEATIRVWLQPGATGAFGLRVDGRFDIVANEQPLLGCTASTVESNFIVAQ